ncbi:26S proteasome non-ATPase regulatory subunit 12 [Psilocybe cubensis]|uniref:PCI domain-containing protein n=2 Tax=Psilocybe cubensis TaxID=181762 RepID=A0A8H8CQH7_PSICU|nr:26S proteasome non-ATPase regulatory subunit 12 [Psilocybe cubensis]KAH9486579.1 26S proteasome non-ATPase regulatory subunit 12 [Psilocybe cubensis]
MSQSSSLDNVLNNKRRRSSIRDGLSIFRTSSKESIKSIKSTGKNFSSYYPYTVYEQTMSPLILRDPEAMKKLFEVILDSPNGKRSLSRLARTCKSFSGPALDVLWKELDSIVPIIGLFPGHLLKKTKKPGLGLAKLPRDEDWQNIIKYSERIQRIAYDEASNVVAPSIFTIFEENRPQNFNYILPRLQELSWKVETPAALERCGIFIHPQLQILNLEISNKFTKINDFLADMSSRTKLKGFSFISPTNLPDAFTELLLRQDDLEKVVLVAPGALSPGVGRWIAALPKLKHLQLDLTGRSAIAVEGFFDELSPRSGDSTPTSIGSRDSGVFSGEELDFTEIRKSALRLTGDFSSKGSFTKLRRIQLTGEVANIAVFLKHLDSDITHLDLVIEDPPDNADWQDLSELICDKFADSLNSLRISPTPSAKFADLVRATSRAEPPSNRLSLERFNGLSKLSRLDIDLPESVVFTPADIDCLAKACPNLESLKLCPLSRFPLPHSPKLTLESLAPLMKHCKRLHTLSVVVNASAGSAGVLQAREMSSKSLLRLHVGHSWANDPLQIAILLSHLMPNLELLKWFQEKNRAGFIEQHAKAWQSVSETLPHIQNLRVTEKSFFRQPVVAPKPITVEKSINATVATTSRGVLAKVSMSDASTQFSPTLHDQQVEAKTELSDASIDATPSYANASVDAAPLYSSTSVSAIEALTSNDAVEFAGGSSFYRPLTRLPHLNSHLPSLFNLLSFAYRFVLWPLSLTSRIFQLIPFFFNKFNSKPQPSVSLQSSSSSSEVDANSADEATDIISLKTLQPNHIPKNMDIYAYEYGYEIHAIHSPSVTAVSKSKAVSSDTHALVNEDPKIVSNPSTWWDEGQILSNNTATRQRDWNARIHNSPAWKYTMSDNKKQEKDFKPEVDELLPQADALIKSGKLQDGLDRLFSLEKQTRNAADPTSTTRLATAALQHCYDAKDYDLVNSTITMLSKKHGQLKTVIHSMVELAISWLPEIKTNGGLEKWLQLLETLRSVTEGKIFLETPRARVTRLLSQHHEGLKTKDSLQTASDLLSELQVETYSSMERTEKVEFIIEQMRLLTALAKQKDLAVEKKDGKDSLGGGEAEWIKVRVGGRKVNEDFLKQKENQELKIKYYNLMITHALHHNAYLDVAKYYHKVWETPSIKEDPVKGKATLERIVYYIVLAPHDNEQSNMLHQIHLDPALANDDLKLHYGLVKEFVTPEILPWSKVSENYGGFLRKTDEFKQDKLWEDLRLRVIEHNIRITAQYFTRIHLTRLTKFLGLQTVKETEEILTRLVNSGTIWAKVDRPAGIINFRSKRSAEDVMNDWSSDMQKLLGLVEKSWMGMNAAQAAQSRVKS